MGCEHAVVDSGDMEIIPLNLSVVQADVSDMDTKAEIGSFADGNYSFGLFIVDPLTGGPQMDGYENIEMRLEKHGDNLAEDYVWSFLPRNSSPRDNVGVIRNRPVNIYSCYPYVSSSTSYNKVKFTSPNTDWRWSTPVNYTSDMTNTSSIDVPLVYHHVMTCIHVRIQCKNSGQVSSKITLADSKADVPNDSRLANTGFFSAEDGKVDMNSLNHVLSLGFNATWVSQDGYDFYFYIPEIVPYDGGLKMTFNIDGTLSPTEYELPVKVVKDDVVIMDLSVNGFEAGKKYSYMLNIDNVLHFTPIGVEENWTVVTDEIDFEL